MAGALPPLNALRAFEATARHLSFSRAAVELHVTPAALSHQIKGLEDFLGIRLFFRKARAIELTEAGRILYPGLHTGFGQLRHAVTSLDRIRNDHVLVISTPPGFTAKWLTPRLHRFLALYPDIDARISSSSHMIDFEADGVDVAIRNARADAATAMAGDELVYEKLVDIAVLPVVSPRYLEQFGEMRAPEDLARAALIFDESFRNSTDMPKWTDWFQKAGVSNFNLQRGLHFNSADHALDAAVEGAGVVLSPYTMAYDDLRHGKLVCPINLRLETPRAFHFVCPKSSENRPNVAALRTWLRQEMDTMLACPIEGLPETVGAAAASGTRRETVMPARKTKRAAKRSRSK